MDIDSFIRNFLLIYRLVDFQIIYQYKRTASQVVKGLLNAKFHFSLQ